MLDSKQEIQAAVDALYAATAKFGRGDVVPWSLIETYSGPRLENRGKYVIGKWRKRLEKEREIVTLPSITVGIRLLTHKQTASEIPRLRQKKAYRQIRRAIKQTALVDDAQLSMAERKMLAAQRSNMASQRRELFRSQKQLANGVIKTEGNPRRVVSQK